MLTRASREPALLWVTGRGAGAGAWCPWSPRSPYGGLRWLPAVLGGNVCSRQRWQGLQSPGWLVCAATRPWVWPLGVSRCAGAAEVR